MRKHVEYRLKENAAGSSEDTISQATCLRKDYVSDVLRDLVREQNAVSLGSHLFIHTDAYRACMRNSIPIGIAPNIEVSIVVQPTDMELLVPNGFSKRIYMLKNRVLKLLAKPLFAGELKESGGPASIEMSNAELEKKYSNRQP